MIKNHDIKILKNVFALIYNFLDSQGRLQSSLAFSGRAMPLGARNAGCFD
jgi:hypothetical protein